MFQENILKLIFHINFKSATKRLATFRTLLKGILGRSLDKLLSKRRTNLTKIIWLLVGSRKHLKVNFAHKPQISKENSS